MGITESQQIPVFSEAERGRRWNLANALMDEENLDALIVYGDREPSFPAPFAPDTFFTNERSGSIVIFPKGEEPIMLVFLPTVIEDHVQARRTHSQSWIRPENIYVGKMGSKVV